jgi:hypothetical protein
MRSTAARIADAIRSHGKGLIFVGTAAAVLGGAGTASAATVTPAHAPALAASQQSDAALRTASSVASVLDMARADVAGAKAAHEVPAVQHGQAAHQVPAVHTPARRVVFSHPVKPQNMSWNQIAELQAHRADPALGRGALPAADQLQPVPVYGPQEYMQLTAAQVTNATTIVKQALVKKMGVRSAVVAVATAMQESELNNINYGTSDSLGLFQQRPSCGWGTAQQIMEPTYAADAFFHALKVYQGSNPDWASQPLYQTAQGVQGSAFPTAYAKWEAQASGLVKHITTANTR